VGRPDTRLADLAEFEADLRQPTISVVVPTLNEAMNLEHLFERMPRNIYEIVLVDGHSGDDTVAVAERLRPDIRIVMQNRRGKGNAMACGFAVCTGDVVVMIDADGSTDPAEIPRFVEALTLGADFAKGSRFIDGGHSDDITRVRRVGNRFLNGLVNFLFRTQYTDLCYGYNAFWREVIPAFELEVGKAGPHAWGDGFEIETLINTRAARRGFAIVEVASVEHARVHGRSNLNAWSDGWRVLRTIFRERCRRHVPAPEDVGQPTLQRVDTIVLPDVVPGVSSEVAAA
jgi:glycosyltransferase involved in cell wall biosynthesis